MKGIFGSLLPTKMDLLSKSIPGHTSSTLGMDEFSDCIFLTQEDFNYEPIEGLDDGVVTIYADQAAAVIVALQKIVKA